VSFPDVIFGICPVCGSDGGDKADASGADAPATDTTGNGVVLEYYQGNLMCQLCKKQKVADVETLIATQRRADEERFRRAAGFVNTV